MNNKQLAEMVKILRKKKLAEISGKPKPFNPNPSKSVDTHGRDERGPNAYNVKEARTPIISGGAQGQSTLGGTGLVNRMGQQRARGQQNIVGRSLNTSHLGEQDEEDLGPTETGQTGKKTEKVTVNPTDTTASATGSMNKNTTTKEIKEK